MPSFHGSTKIASDLEQGLFRSRGALSLPAKPGLHAERDRRGRGSINYVNCPGRNYSKSHARWARPLLAMGTMTGTAPGADATALRALETMTDVVAGVKLDRAMKSQ